MSGPYDKGSARDKCVVEQVAVLSPAAPDRAVGVLSWLASGRVSTRPERMCVFPLRPGLLSEKTA